MRQARAGRGGWPARRYLALAVGLGAVALLVPLAAQPLTRVTFAALLGLLGLIAGAAAAADTSWQAGDAGRGKLFGHVFGPALALGAACILGLTLLYDTNADRGPATLLFLLLLVGSTASLLRLVAPPLVPALPLGALAILLALAASRQATIVAALTEALPSAALWGTLGAIAGGSVVLVLLGRYTGAPGYYGVSLLVYTTTTVSLAAWWRWGEPYDRLSALASGPDRAVAQIVPLAIVAGTIAQLTITLLSHRATVFRPLGADLAAHLILLGLPIGAAFVARRPATAIEKQFAISWLALVLIVFVAARAAVALVTLVRIAPDATIGERRVAFALFVLCCAVYWPAGQWRSATHNLTGDETQYIAATISLLRYHNLEVTNVLLDPNNGMASQLGYRQVDIYEDQARDRMVFATPAGPVTTSYLPIAGGDGLDATIELLNPGIEPASVALTFHDAAGRDVGGLQVSVAAGGMAIFPAPPTTSGGLSAIVTAGKPIAVAVRLRDQNLGDESYAGMVALSRSCIPIHPGDPAWRGELVMQNPLPNAASATWQYFDAAGIAGAPQQLTIPPEGSVVSPLPFGPGPGTLCVVSDGPLASLLLVRGAPGLLVQQGRSAQDGKVTIPEPPRAFATRATSEVLIHNPAAEPVQVTLSGFADASITIPAHGTRQAVIEGGAPVGGQTEDQIDHSWLSPAGPIVVSVLATVGRQAAALAPNVYATNSLVIPVITGGTDHYILGHLQLTNNNPADIMAITQLRDLTGKIVWQDKLWVCANCTITHPFWYRSATGGALTITASQSLTATLLQREVVVSWPAHGIGPSLIALPAFALAGWPGVLALCGIVGAALATAVYGLLSDVGVGRRAGLLTAALLAWSAPLISYSAQFYPETSAALLLTVALQLGGARRFGWRRIALALGCLAAVPFFHARLLPLSLIQLAALGLRLVWQLRRTHDDALRVRWLRQWPWITAAAALTAAAAVLLVSRDARLQPAFLRDYLSEEDLVPRMLGILFDNATGLLPCLPILLLVGSGYGWASRRAPFLSWTALALGVIQLIFVALRHGGWQLWSPPGRYILSAIPFFALAIGATWERGFHRPIWLLATPLWAWGLLFGAFYTWIPAGAYFVPLPYYWFADDILKALVGTNPARLFPSVSPYADLTFGRAAALVAVLVVGFALGMCWRIPRPRARGGVDAPIINWPRDDGDGLESVRPGAR